MSRLLRRLPAVLLLCCVVAERAALAAGDEASSPTLDPDRALVVGRVTTNPRKDFERHQAFAYYLASRLRDAGIEAGGVRFASTTEELAALLRSGEVDVVGETVFAALALAELAGAELVLREWRNGLASNHTIFFARKDSGIDSLDDLVGRRMAFEDPGSATSYILPRAALEEAGHPLMELPATGAVPADAVGYQFAQEEINVTSWVHTGRADAGALGNQDWDDPERMPPAMRQDLQVFHRTASVPRAVLLMRGDMPPSLKRRIADILTSAHEDAEGRRVLDLYRQVTHYDRLEGEVAAEIASAREIARTLR